MQHEFWHERWQRKQIGFHQELVNPYLARFWRKLNVPVSRVFVPLCGKSRDMLWLREQGHEVVGVELSQIAVEEFFAENGLTPEVDVSGSFKRYRAQGYTLLCGDFFALAPTDLGEIGAVYDRASLIALPPALRKAYVAHMQSLQPAGVQTLLVTFQYPQHQMEGPPFSVEANEVEVLFGESWMTELLCDEDILAQEPRFRDKGITRLHEQVYLLERR